MGVFLFIVILAYCQGVLGGSGGVARRYYIQAELRNWSYVSDGINHCRGDAFNDNENKFAVRSDIHIGPTYLKASYQQYSSSSFTQRLDRAPEWEHVGIVGPVLRAMVGDTIKVVFRNSLAFAVNLRVNTALVLQQPPGSNIPVAPGGTTTYRWTVGEEAGPAAGDGSSIAWVYRSYVDATAHDYAGLVGVLIVTRRGMMTSSTQLRPRDVDREFVLLFSVFDENKSPLFDTNMLQLPAIPTDEDDFIESNLKHSINGRMFCDQAELLTMLLTERVRWYVIDLGTEVDLHTPHWHGDVLSVRRTYVDEFKMEPGSIVMADMRPDNSGTWLLHCHVNDHIAAGMISTYTIDAVDGHATSLADTASGRIVSYFVAAEEIMWDYMVNGPQCTGSTFVRDLYPEAPHANVSSLSTVFKKVLYICYTDETFTTPCARSAGELHQGFLGPVLRGNVGDTIQVTFKNKATLPYSMHPHGVFYNKSSEGAPYVDNTPGNDGAIVQPNNTHVYNWFVREEAGPRPGEPTTMLWMYHSHVDEIADTNSGLLGLIVISRYGLTRDYDREFFMSLSVMDETVSHYYNEYLSRVNLPQGVTSLEELQADSDFQSHVHMMAINGFEHCNMPTLVMQTGERVRWYLVTIGTEIDIHTTLWEGQTVVQNHMRKAAVVLQPASMRIADMAVTTCGAFHVLCGVHEHLEHGMLTNFVVLPDASQRCPSIPAPTRTIYIAAEEYVWDFAPRNKGCFGANFTEQENTYVRAGPDRIGKQYIKARFRAYSNAQFTRPLSQPSWSGILGPTLRMTVGDAVRVVFRNRLAFPANVVPQGLRYDSAAIAAQGATVTYTWYADSTAGPASNDFSTVAWMYRSSYAQSSADNAGLVGAIIVARRGMLRADGSIADVSRDYVLGVSIIDENHTPLLLRNVAVYLGNATAVDIFDPDFEEANLKHTMNGFLHCNLRLTALVGDRVRLHLISVGTVLDMHSVTVRDTTAVSGSSVTTRQFASDSYAGATSTVDIFPQAAGRLAVQCDVHDHHDAGMVAWLNVARPRP